MRRHVPALSLLGTLILLPACASTAAAPAAAESAVSPDTAIEVLTLQHADAADVADVLRDLVRSTGDTTTRVAAHARLNAVVVSGDEEIRERVRDLVALLDRPPER